jgi:hypothetical protein
VASYFRIFGPGWTFSWFSPRVNLLAPAEGRVDFHRMVHDLKYALYVFLCLLGAVSIPWFLVRTLKRSDAPLKLAVKWGGSVVVLGTFIPLAFACGPFGPLILVPMAFILSVMWTPHIADLVSRPLTSIFDGGNEPLEPKPYYSIAISKRQRGQFTEAVAALREQLAKFPNDFEGVLLLANIQAENMADLQGAEITLNHFCDSPGAAAPADGRGADATGGLAPQAGAGFGLRPRGAPANHRAVSGNGICPARRAAPRASGRRGKIFDCTARPAKSRRAGRGQ